MRKLIALTLLLVGISSAMAQTYPSASPAMIVTGRTATGDELVNEEVTEFDGNAPLEARFEVRPQNLNTYTGRYEWRFYKNYEEKPFLTRLGTEEYTEFSFRETGSFTVKLYATFTSGSSTIEYEQDNPFTISIAESYLEVPNAFSPNGDGINDIFRVKDNHRSIIEFKATVYDRWFKKLHEWTDITAGWDGKSGGHDAPEGAYYLNIQAKGADGRKYHIKKTINLLRGYDETLR